MKGITILLSIALMIFTSCNNNEADSDAYGNFEAIDVMVAAESPGKLLSFSIEEGQQINSEEIVGVIDTMQLHLKMQQLYAGIRTVQTKSRTLNAQLESYKVQVENLERELKRVENLLEDGAATPKQKDDIEGQLKLIRTQVIAVESQKATIAAESNTLNVQITQLRDQISRASIKNPVSGVVLQKYKEQGEIVAPGQNLYKIANLKQLILRAYVSGDQLSRLEIGEEITVRIDTEDGMEALPGSLIWVSSEAEFTPKIIQTKEERVNLVYAIKVTVNNDGRLKIGMPAEIKF